MNSISLETIVVALTFIDAHDRETWVKVGNALKTEFGEIAFDVWDKWSQTADNYDAKAAKSVWRSLKVGKVNIGTVIYLAKQNGFELSKHESKPIDPQEQAERKAKREQQEREAIAHEQAEQAAFMPLLPKIEQAANAALSTPHCENKGISSNGVLLINSTELHRFKHPLDPKHTIGFYLSGAITLVPYKRLDTKQLVAFQAINGIPDSEGKNKGRFSKRWIGKSFVGGGYYWRGDIDKPSSKVIVEGMSDTHTVYEQTYYPTLAAGNDEHLKQAAQDLRSHCPDDWLVIMGDNDPNKKGERLAKEAAIAVNGIFLLPPSQYKDVNEWYLAEGGEVIKKMIDAALADFEAAQNEKAVPPDTESTAQNITTDDKFTIKRQYFSYCGGSFCLDTKGVHYTNAEDSIFFVCSPLWVRAKTRTGQGEAWGRLLEWIDDDKNLHQWAMPLELLEGDCADVRRELAHKGVSIDHSKRGRDLLAIYLKIVPVEARALCVERLGWHDDVYILPKRVIGASEEIIVFQNPHGIENPFSQSGTAEQWRDNVACFAIENSRFLLALSFAFGAPLFELSNAEGGGIHFLGGSSIGKSTFLDAACSTWGKPKNYKREWRNTANAIEGLCALHNNGLLVLDEIHLSDAKTVGQTTYMIVNGQSKGRMSKNGSIRPISRWNTPFLSGGEKTLEGYLKESGQTINAGQAVRLANVKAEVCKGSAFEVLHGIESGEVFSKLIKDNANKYYGTVGIAWLEYVAANKESITSALNTGIKAWLNDNVTKGASGQVSRVASRFALVAVAGELATKQGLTGWPIGESNNAAKLCFNDWLLSFGGIGNHEDRAILAHVKAFFEAHGSSRFEALEQMSGDKVEKVINRVGFWEQDNAGKRYVVFQESFKNEICKGYDHKQVIRILSEADILIKDKDGKNTIPRRTPESPKLTRMYVINAEMLFSEGTGCTTCTDTDFKEDFSCTPSKSESVQGVKNPPTNQTPDKPLDICTPVYTAKDERCTDKKFNEINDRTPCTPCTLQKHNNKKNQDNFGFDFGDDSEVF